MVPTARAQSLLPAVRQVLLQIQGMLAPEGPFDPTSSHHFRVAVTDYVGLTLLAEVASRVVGRYPRLSLETVALDDWQVPLAELNSGRLDLVVSFFRGVPEPLSAELLFKERFVCVIRRGHPCRGKRLSLKEFTSLPHLLVSPHAGLTGVVDVALAAYDCSRKVAVSVPHFMSAPPILASTDCVATLPTRVAQLGSAMARLRLLAPPIPLPEFSVSMVWHPQLNRNPAAAWLRERVREAAASWAEKV